MYFEGNITEQHLLLMTFVTSRQIRSLEICPFSCQWIVAFFDVINIDNNSNQQPQLFDFI